MNDDNTPIALSIKDTARRTGLSRSFLYKAIRSGELKSLKCGRRRLVRADDAAAYLDAHRTTNTAA